MNSIEVQEQQPVKLRCEPVATLGRPGDDNAVAVYRCRPVTRRDALRTSLLILPALMVEFVGGKGNPMKP